MRVLIVEDEAPAAGRIVSLLEKSGTPVEIAGVTTGVESTVNWLGTHPQPDLILMDIQLEDGLSFEIFEAVEVKAPVIFTTAFDAYALKAFSVNSIDYLLKPVELPALQKALARYSAFFAPRRDEIVASLPEREDPALHIDSHPETGDLSKLTTASSQGGELLKPAAANYQGVGLSIPPGAPSQGGEHSVQGTSAQELLVQRSSTPAYQVPDWRKLLEQLAPPRKERFLVKCGSKFRSVQASHSSLFTSEGGDTYMKTFDGHTYAIDYTLDQLQEQLDPNRFFRVNRSFILNADAVADMIPLSGSKMKVKIKGDPSPEGIIVSRDRLREFKRWLDR